MRIKLTILIAIIGIIIACSIPGEPADDITIENYKISVTFDREKHEFGDLKLKSKLETINFPDSILIKSIIDTTLIDFDSLYVGDIKDSIRLVFNSGYPIPAGDEVPSLITADSISNIPNDEVLNWAFINSGTAKILIKNRYNDLIFNSVNCKIVRRNDPYFLNPSLQSPDGEVVLTDRIVIDTTLTNITPNTDTTLDLDFKDKWITNGMSFVFTADNQELSGSTNTGIDETQYLGFDLTINKCRFDSVSADFSSQTAEETDNYSTKADKVKLRYIVAKNAEVNVTAENKTDFLLSIGGMIDSLYNLRDGNSPLEIPQAIINPRESYIHNPINIDSCKLVADFEAQSLEILTTLNCSSSDPLNRFVKYCNRDKAMLFFQANSNNTDDERMGFYEIDCVITNDTIQVPAKSVPFSDDIDWDDFADINITDITLKLAVEFPRLDLLFQNLRVRNFALQGKKSDGSTSPLYPVNDIDFKYNFNKDTVQLIGMEQLFNFKPDSILYKADLILSYDGKLYDTDRLDMDLIIEMPLTVTVTDSVMRRNDIDEIDAFLNEDDIIEEVISLKINAFINNPIDSAQVLFEVKISDQADTANGELQGSIKRLLKVWLMPNPVGTNGYMLNDLPENQALGITSEGISFPQDVIDLMLYNDTYMQTTITIYPEYGNQATITLTKEDFVESQIKFSGEFKLKSQDGE